MDLRNERTAGMILGGLCAVALLCIFFGTKLLPFTYRARAEEIGELELRHGELSGELARARQKAARLPDLDAEYQTLERKWEKAKTLLPEQREIATLLREITFRGESCGVKFALFKPQPAIPREEFTERPVEIKVDGGYHEIANFLNELARMDRIVHVRDLEIEQVPPGSGEEKAARARFVAVAYVIGGNGVGQQEEGSGGSDTGLAGKVKGLVKGRKRVAPTSQTGVPQGGTEE